jgi:hypothetical protein
MPPACGDARSAKWLGLNLPVIPMAHLYIMTKPMEGVTNKFPNLRDPDLLVYWREEVGGLVTGGYERQPATFGMNGIPRDFKFKLLEPDWERFTPLDGKLHPPCACGGKCRSEIAIEWT